MKKFEVGIPAGGSVVKNSANVGDGVQSQIQEDPLEERKWQPTQVFCLGNLVDRGAGGL